MQTITVPLSKEPYSIYLGEGLLHQKEIFAPHITGKEVMVITNETLAPLYLDTLLSTLAAYKTDFLVLHDGEKYKNLKNLKQIYSGLLAKSHHRDTTLIALGGGVVGDITGFAAATYQRGVSFIQVPTSLLAMVDASIGGKTAVNHPLGKNMIGSFHQPKAVIQDILTLKTLPAREFQSGLAEVIKHALIQDAEYFHWIEQNIASISDGKSWDLLKTISRSCEIKGHIVATDEREKHQRALLNFGHTVGHALEKCLNYENLLHGEAVSVGMRVASKLSCVLGCITQDEEHRIAQLLLAARLPVSPPAGIKVEDILKAMSVDKKVLDNNLRFVLLKSIGEGFLKNIESEVSLRNILVECGFEP